MKKDNEIKLLVETIVKSFNIKRVILFGSHANGNSNENSDIDLCIITNENKRKLNIIREIRSCISSIINSSLDLVVYNEDEFNKRSSLKSTMEYKIKNEGVNLYG